MENFVNVSLELLKVPTMSMAGNGMSGNGLSGNFDLDLTFAEFEKILGDLVEV